MTQYDIKKENLLEAIYLLMYRQKVFAELVFFRSDFPLK